MKVLSTLLAFLMLVQPVVYGCEDIEPIDPESLEYDPKRWLKNTLAEEGQVDSISAGDIGRFVGVIAEDVGTILSEVAFIGDVFYFEDSLGSLGEAIENGDVAGEVFSSINLVASLAIPAISAVNPIVGIVTFAVIMEGQAIYSLVEESNAYHKLLSQLAEYRSNLQEQIDEIETKMINRIQSVALKQNQWHLKLSENDGLGYRIANLRTSQAQVVPQIQDVVDTCVQGLIEYELKPYVDEGFLTDIPHVTSNQLFNTVTEMELTLSEIINELGGSTETASFASDEGFLDVVNSAVVDGVERNLLVLLPPVVSNLLATADCTSNLLSTLDYSVSEYGRKEFLQSHLSDIEELAWLYFLYYFADNPDVLGGLTDPAVGASVLAASAWVPVVGLVLLATAGPAIGSKLLQDDQEVIRAIMGMKQFINYCARLEASILADSEVLSLAVTEFIDSQVHPFVSSAQMKSVLEDAILYARQAVLMALPHSVDEEDIAGLEQNDAYALALANIEALEVSDGEYIRFAMHGDFPLEASHFDLTPDLEQGSTNMMVHFDDERATLEISSSLTAGDWSLATSNSPMVIASDNFNETVFFRANPKNLEEGNEDGNGIATLAVQKDGKDDGLKKPDRGDPNDVWTALMPGSITNEGNRVVVEMFVEGNSNYHDSVVIPYLENTLSDVLFDDFEEYIRSIADPVSHTNALHWLEDVKDEGIEEIAIKEGLRTTAGLIIKQLSGFLASDERAPSAFTNLAENIEINWAIIKDEVIVHIDGEPVDYYTLDRIPGTQYLVDQFVGWANNMGRHIEQNGWRHLDRYPAELFSFIWENGIENEAVSKLEIGVGHCMRQGSSWYQRRQEGRLVIGAFPMEVMRKIAVNKGELNADRLLGPHHQFYYDAHLDYRYNWNWSPEPRAWRPSVDYELAADTFDGNNVRDLDRSGWVGRATVTENNPFGMWPESFHTQTLSVNHSIYNGLTQLNYYTTSSEGRMTFYASNSSKTYAFDYEAEGAMVDRSSSGNWGYVEYTDDSDGVPRTYRTWTCMPAVLKTLDNDYVGYEPSLGVSLDFVRLADDGRFRGFKVGLDLNLAEFIWMTRRRGFNHGALNEVKVRVHTVMHQRYTHSLPHEGEEASTKEVDRDIYCMEEKVIMDAEDIDLYREGTLPNALRSPIMLNKFSTTSGLPSHETFDISSQRSYAELMAVELIFNGDTRYVFLPDANNKFTDASSSDGSSQRDLSMYFYDPNPAHAAQIERFNDYDKEDLVGLELPTIMQHYQ